MVSHSTDYRKLPYRKLYILLEYKLAMYGIRFVKQNEAYSSQTSPLMPEVCKENAEKSNRVKRGLYTDGNKNGMLTVSELSISCGCIFRKMG